VGEANVVKDDRMSFINSIAKDWLPAAIIRWLRRIWVDRIRYRGEFSSWDEAASHSSGYDAEHILAKVLDATLKVKRGEAAYERDSVLFEEIEYTWPITAGLMWAAAQSSGRLDVLDFGGALGSSYYQNRDFLRSLDAVRWSVVEQPHYVKDGQRYIQDERLRFYETIEECLNENTPNVILLSSVLQYLKNPVEILQLLACSGAKCIIIERTPFNDGPDSKLVIQNVPSHIYKASYPMWIFNEAKLLKEIEKNFIPLTSFVSPEGFIRGQQSHFIFKGMILGVRS